MPSMKRDNMRDSRHPESDNPYCKPLQLRLLAQDGDGGKLMDRFFLEAAKSKKANAAQQPNQNAAEAARNMDIPNMGKN